MLILALTISCQEVFEPEVEDMDPFLVIEGAVSTKPGNHFVSIHQSRPFSLNPYFPGMTGYTVYITNQDDERFDYLDLNNGKYLLNLLEDDLPLVGETYTLHIISPEGDEYVSSSQKIVTSPEISKLYCEYAYREVLSEDAYGNPLELELPGLELYLETDGIYPVNNHYIYEYYGYEQHHTRIKIGILEFNLYRHQRLNTRFGNKITTLSADDFGEYKVREENFLFLAEGDMINYDPIVDDSIEVLNTWFEGAVFRLNQYSVSPDAYNFYSAVEDQLAAEGRMFDPAVPQITGNITCVSDSLKPVVGVFTASDVSSGYAYFYFDYRERYFTRPLDSFPELWLDTCSWGMPESWIMIPY